MIRLIFYKNHIAHSVENVGEGHVGAGHYAEGPYEPSDAGAWTNVAVVGLKDSIWTEETLGTQKQQSFMI